MDPRENWIEEVFDSMKDSQRARPPQDLFKRIQTQIEDSDTKIIPMFNWRRYAIAASFIILINSVALIYSHGNSGVSQQGYATVGGSYSESLINSYQFYE